jgi:hypothetical protein
MDPVGSLRMHCDGEHGLLVLVSLLYPSSFCLVHTIQIPEMRKNFHLTSMNTITVTMLLLAPCVLAKLRSGFGNWVVSFFLRHGC